MKLLQANADVDIPNNNRYNALQLAAVAGDLEAIEVLLTAQPNLELATTDGLTALMLAARHNQVPVLKRLIQAGGKVERMDNEGFWPYYYAHENGYTDVEEMLREANPQKFDANNVVMANIAFYVAIELANVPILQRLASEYNAKDNMTYHTGGTPLTLATLKGNIDVINALIEIGADVNHTDIDGDTALIYRDCRENSRSGADIDHARPDGVTALMYAAQFGHTEIVRMLIDANADVDCTVAVNGNTALILALSCAHPNCAELLIPFTKDLNHANSDVRTALLIATTYDTSKMIIGKAREMHAAYIKLVEQLLDRGVDVDCRTELGMTPIMTACVKRRSQIVELLIAAGATLEFVDNNEKQRCTMLKTIDGTKT